VAALSLCDKLSGLSDRSKLEHWLVSRQQYLQGGFNGRIEKLEDVCYSFWCGASLQVLGIHHLTSIPHDVQWLLSCQTSIGGISKTPDDHPDVMHSYLALAALSLHAQEDEQDGETAIRGLIKPIDARLNLSLDSLDWLRRHLY
jgi:geranylgeranyl transferase type-1 subunit beta